MTDNIIISITEPVRSNNQSDERVKDARSTQQDSPPPAAYRPGHLEGLQILERIFPYEKRHLLEETLKQYKGDMVQAIEHFVTKRSGTNHNLLPPTSVERRTDLVPNLSQGGQQRLSLPSFNKSAFNAVQSSHLTKFSHLPSHQSPFIHSAFMPQTSAFTGLSHLPHKDSMLPLPFRTNASYPGLPLPPLPPVLPASHFHPGLYMYPGIPKTMLSPSDRSSVTSVDSDHCIDSDDSLNKSP